MSVCDSSWVATCLVSVNLSLKSSWTYTADAGTPGQLRSQWSARLADRTSNIYMHVLAYWWLAAVTRAHFLNGYQNISSFMFQTPYYFSTMLSLIECTSPRLARIKCPHVQCMYDSLESTSLSLTTQMLPQLVMITIKKKGSLCHCLESLKTVMPLFVPGPSAECRLSDPEDKSLLSLQCCNELDLCPFSMTLESFAKMLVGNGRHNCGPVQSSPVQSSPESRVQVLQ